MNEQRHHLFEAMHHGTMIITPNNRLSHQLLQDYYARQHQPCVDKPRCLAYPSFLQYLFHQLRHSKPSISHPVLFSAQQTRFLWRQILNESRQSPCNDGLIDAIMRAWQSCEEWLISPEHQAFQSTQQTKQFQHWHQTLHHRLTKLNAITEPQLVSYLLKHVSSYKQPMMWVSFDDYTPAQRALQHMLNMQGSEQLHHDFTHVPPTSYVMHAHDPDDEYQHVLHWIKTRFTKGDRRIGVVIPDLNAKSNYIQRLFARHFPKEHLNISLGKPLAAFPLAAHALQWLNLDALELSHHQLTLLMTSPYINCNEHESSLRAQFMQDNPLMQENRLPFSQLTSALKSSLPTLAKQLEQLTTFPESGTPEQWIATFKKRLAVLGFPGQGFIDSETYQCFQRLNKLFDEFRELSIVQTDMTKEEALLTFTDLANTTIFQPQKNHASIQVLGLLEASGCLFDSLWVTNMTDQCLPEKTHLSAFIPITLQRELNMPHALAERELSFATKIIHRLRQGSETLVFSYAHLIDDKPCMPSPLIRDYPPLETHPLTTQTKTLQRLSRVESYTLALQDTESITGGTTLLTNQAKCPFRAFAAHRLHAKQTLSSSDGLNAMERGQLIHRVLELVWMKLKNQHALLNESEITRKNLVQDSIINALKSFVEHHPLSFPPLLQSIEIKRLTRLVEECFEWEKTRPEFHIEALEHATTIDLEGLTFHIKVDRIDATSSGKKWVIDYKSRLPATKPWREDRPEAPQLLLYALLDKHINGLAFVELNKGHVASSGFCEEKTDVQGITALDDDEEWTNHQAKWHTQLSSLVREFKTGHCSPTPTKKSTCNTCEFQSLCRVDMQSETTEIN